MGKDKDPIKDLIEKSGNNFHFKVVKFLRDKGWEVLISPYYTDNITDKPREIDIIADKEFTLKNEYTALVRRLNIRLFIECKYINSETVFWFDKKDKVKAKNRVEKNISVTLHPDPAHEINKHHYLKEGLVAKLSESINSKSQEHEIIHKALNQSLNAMIYYKNPRLVLPRTIKTVSYPLILCNSFDNFYKIDAAGNSSHTKITDKSFQLEVNYVYLDKDKNSCSDYFLIDIINFKKFSDFLQDLEKEINAIIHRWADKIDKQPIT